MAEKREKDGKSGQRKKIRNFKEKRKLIEAKSHTGQVCIAVGAASTELVCVCATQQ